MITYLLSLALLAQVPPPDVETAIREYHVQQTHEAERDAARALGILPPAPEAPPTPEAPLAGSPRLLALIRPSGTTDLRSAVTGEKLILLGENLPAGGRVMMARQEATVLRRTATYYELIVPAVPSLPTGPLDLRSSSNGFLTRLTNTFTILPRPPEPVLTRHYPPQVVGYRKADGTPLVGSAAGGTALWVDGYGFGAARGQVWVGAAPVGVEAWSETSIRIRLPVGRPAGARAETVTVFVPGQRGITMQAFEVRR